MADLDYLQDAGSATGFLTTGPIQLVDWFWLKLASFLLRYFDVDLLAIEKTPEPKPEILMPVSTETSAESAHEFYDEMVEQMQPYVDETLRHLSDLITQTLGFAEDVNASAPPPTEPDISPDQNPVQTREELIQAIIRQADESSTQFRTAAKQKVEEYQVKFSPIIWGVSQLESQKKTREDILQECEIRESRLEQLAEDLKDPAFVNRNEAQTEIDRLVEETQKQTQSAQFDLEQIDQELESQCGENQRFIDEGIKIKDLYTFLSRFASYISVTKTINQRRLKPSTVTYTIRRLVEFLENDSENHLSILASKQVLRTFAAIVSRFKYRIKTSHMYDSEIDQVTKAIADELITAEMARN